MAHGVQSAVYIFWIYTTRSFIDDCAIRYVFPVLWMTSCFT